MDWRVENRESVEPTFSSETTEVYFIWEGKTRFVPFRGKGCVSKLQEVEVMEKLKVQKYFRPEIIQLLVPLTGIGHF